ncbi:DUF3068 domain-containing protein [Nocardia pseudovaccinii]|uniref:DUF3068 domain-containing protein n=1 Tax=Nocardia pseudovaccinii TaxID=189540 RepID=UPI0007A3EDA5|nr:DUF3068 domain-containing protein [Nocardia pseudovaccinii]
MLGYRHPDTDLPCERGAERRDEARAGRGVLGFVAIAVAAVFAVVAALLPIHTADAVIKVPAPIRQVTMAVGTGAVLDLDLLMRGKVQIQSKVPVQVSSLVTSVEPTDSDSITLRVAQQTSRLDRQGQAGLLDALVDQVSISRTSGTPRHTPAQTVFEPGQRPLETVRSGFQYKFPFDTGRHDYPYFDVISQQETRLRYVDDTTVRDGLRLLHFRSQVPPVDLAPLLPMRGEITLPAESVGRAGDQEVAMSLYYTATRDIWVEPVTGAVITVSEYQHRYLATASDDPAAITVFDGTLQFDEQSVHEMTGQARDARRQIAALHVYGPIAAAIAAMAALTFGITRLRTVTTHR